MLTYDLNKQKYLTIS